MLSVFRALHPGAQESSWCLAPAAASGRCPFRNSALLLKPPSSLRPSFTESIAVHFKSSLCLEILQTAPYLPLSSSSSPPPLLKLPSRSVSLIFQYQLYTGIGYTAAHFINKSQPGLWALPHCLHPAQEEEQRQSLPEKLRSAEGKAASRSLEVLFAAFAPSFRSSQIIP